MQRDVALQLSVVCTGPDYKPNGRHSHELLIYVDQKEQAIFHYTGPRQLMLQGKFYEALGQAVMDAIQREQRKEAK